ncbi:AMP-binding protein [bacterium]|nr:AMP-binding protein [bacterium]
MTNQANTIPELLSNSFSIYKNLPSISFAGEEPLLYKELQDKIMEISHLLLKNGIKKGDKIAILGDNSPNWVISYLSIVFTGAVAVPILPGFTDTDTHHVLRNSDSVAVFVSQKHANKIEDINIPNLFTQISLEDFSVSELHKPIKSNYHDFVKSLSKKLGKDASAAEIVNASEKPNAENLAAIIYTSGTTGNSKGVMLTHKNIVSDVLNSLKKFPLTSNDRFLSILPLSHTFEATGGMLCPLTMGVSIYYMRGLPTPQKLLDSMKAVKPTGVLTVPLVIDKIYRKKILPKIESSSLLRIAYKIPVTRKLINKKAGAQLITSFGGALRFFMFGGAALNSDVEIFLRDADISYSTGYGMTETSPIMTINPFGKVKMGSCGQVIPGVEMKIHKPDPKTGIGEIIVRSPIVMKGYYKNKEATEKVFIEDGWMKTGDIGYFDKHGYLFIKGRSKNVIVGPSGENIYPENIELLLSQNQFIQQAVVYESEGLIHALVYPDYDAVDNAITEENENSSESIKESILEQVRLDINEQLPSFSKINKIKEHQEPFKMTPTNKIKRYLYISS